MLHSEATAMDTHAKVLHHMPISGSIDKGVRAEGGTVPSHLTKRYRDFASSFIMTIQEYSTTAIADTHILSLSM